MGAMIFKVPPHWGHFSMSISNTRLSPVVAKTLTHLGCTAPSSGQGLRSIPTGLIAHQPPFPSGSAPEPTLPLRPRSPETPKTLSQI
jgi:hypothetical protein